MAEYDPRPAHDRTYLAPDGRVAYITVDDRGIVTITEELLHDLFTRAGFTETTKEPQP